MLRYKYLLFSAQWLPYVPPGITFRNFILCAQSAFRACVLCMDLRTNNDYYESVYIVHCAVQTEYLNVITLVLLILKCSVMV
jgi:hypothetical protein